MSVDLAAVPIAPPAEPDHCDADDGRDDPAGHPDAGGELVAEPQGNEPVRRQPKQPPPETDDFARTGHDEQDDAEHQTRGGGASERDHTGLLEPWDQHRQSPVHSEPQQKLYDRDDVEDDHADTTGTPCGGCTRRRDFRAERPAWLVLVTGLAEGVVQLDQLKQIALGIAERGHRAEALVVRLDEHGGTEFAALGQVFVETTH